MAWSFLRFSVLLQKHRTPLLLTACGGIFSASIFQHVFPDHTHLKLYQAWQGGAPARLSEPLEGVFQEVLEDSGVASGFKAFASFGFHPVGAGLPWLPQGAWIGIPANFKSSAHDPSGISDRTLLIGGRELEWDSEAGVALRSALVLSPRAQRFALAREVACLSSGAPLLLAGVAPACLAGACVGGVALGQMFRLHAGSLLFRAGVKGVAVGVALVCYLLGWDALGQWLDYRCDRRAALLSADYAQGGVEFYQKLLARNRTLRSLMGRDGEAMYAASGNLFPGHLLRLRHAPYTARRDRILRILEKEK